MSSARKPLCATSRLILELLREDSRRSLTELGDIVGCSPPTVSYHINQLKARGYILRFTIDVDPHAEAKPRGVRAMFDVRLRRNVCGMVFAAISDWKELVSVWSTAGSIDMRILIEAADQSMIEDLRDRLARHPEVASLVTTFVLKTWCERISGIHETSPETYTITRNEVPA